MKTSLRFLFGALTAIAAALVFATAAQASPREITIRTETDFRQVLADGDDTLIVTVDGTIYLYDGEFVIERDVTLRGGGTLIVRTHHRHFHVRPHAVLTLDGVTLQGRGSASGGGAEVRGGTFNMHSGAIIENNSNMGGGIYAIGGTINIFGGEIRENTAEGVGGGIFGSNGTIITMYGGEIIYNRVEGGFSGGGGVYLRATSRPSYFFMHGGLIANNSSNWLGGGVGLSHNTSMVMTGGVITGNSAGRGGGVQVSRFAMFTASGGTISNNTAGMGGAIGGVGFFGSFSMGEITIGSDVIFYGNTANYQHNFGLHAGRDVFPHIRWSGDSSVTGTHLFNNYDIHFDGITRPAAWQIHLGLIALVGIVNAIIFIARRKSKQKATKAAAVTLVMLAAMLASSAQHAYASQQSRHITVTNEDELRAAAEVHDAIITIEGTINISDYIPITTRLTLTGNGTITVSEHHRHFRVEGWGSRLTMQGNVTLTRAEGYDGLGGGIVVGHHARLVMNGGSISGNAWTHGGAVDVFEAATFVMTGGEISGNHATREGGGLYVGWYFRHGGLFEMRGGRIVGNTADGVGGGIFAINTNLRLFDGDISGNTAVGHGGLFADVRSTLTTGTNIRIFDNTPANANETTLSPFMRLITPNAIRFAAIFALAAVGTAVTLAKRKQRSGEINT